MAFGPGRVTNGTHPKSLNTVLAAHRDTHFSFLKDLKRGDALTLQSTTGESYEYTVSDLAVVHETQTEVLLPTEQATLTLITCYPFDALNPGGPLRYVVRAAMLR
jgi:sortase A